MEDLSKNSTLSTVSNTAHKFFSKPTLLKHFSNQQKFYPVNMPAPAIASMALLLTGCGGGGDSSGSAEVVAPVITGPSTSKPSTSKPSTSTPSTSTPSTSTPSTSKPSTSKPSTSTPSTPSTSKPSTSKPSTSKPSISEPSISKPSTEEPSIGSSDAPVSNSTDSTVDDVMDKKRLNDIEAARFLQYAQFSSTENEINYLKRVGIERWLNRQFYLRSGIGGYDWLYQQGYNTNEYRYSDRPGDRMAWQQLLSAKDTLRKRMALALSEIMVLSCVELSMPHRGFALGAYWDLLNKHAFGNFRSLLRDITLNMGMGAYLDLRHSRKADSRGRRPDENYAREVMQLFTIGLVELNLDGTPKLRGGKPIETYTQETVTNIARALTGWTVDSSYTTGSTTNPEFTRQPMRNIPSRHDTRSSTFFGATVPAGSTGEEALEIVVDTLFNHPNVAPFICKQLIQRLVTSNPSPQYVRRVATVFNSDNKGRRGHLKSVLVAILTNDEALNPPPNSQPTVGKVREPMIRLIQWAHTFTNRKSVSGQWMVSKTDNRKYFLNQSPFRAPSVFNYFDADYSPNTEAFNKNNIIAPELQLHNETATVGYINHIKRVIEKGIFYNFIETRTEVEPNYSNEMKLYNQPEKLVEHLNLILCAGQMSPKTISLITTAVEDVTEKTSRDWKKDRIHLAIFMTMVSPDYLVQK